MKYEFWKDKNGDSGIHRLGLRSEEGEGCRKVIVHLYGSHRHRGGRACGGPHGHHFGKRVQLGIVDRHDAVGVGHSDGASQNDSSCVSVVLGSVLGIFVGLSPCLGENSGLIGDVVGQSVDFNAVDGCESIIDLSKVGAISCQVRYFHENVLGGDLAIGNLNVIDVRGVGIDAELSGFPV